MITIVRAQPGKANEFREKLIELAREVRKERGCVCFVPYEALDAEVDFHRYEIYANPAAFEERLQADHVRRYMASAPNAAAVVDHDGRLQLEVKQNVDLGVRLKLPEVVPSLLPCRNTVSRTERGQYTRFAAAPVGLAQVDEDLTFAEYWTDTNRYAYYDKKRRKCAEVLVPDRVEPRFITGVFVSCQRARAAYAATGVTWPAIIDPHLFFSDATSS